MVSDVVEEYVDNSQFEDEFERDEKVKFVKS